MGRSFTVFARIGLLIAAVACVLLGLRFAPALEIGQVGRPTATIVNDSFQTVVVERCVKTCAEPDQPATLAAGRSLRIEPGAAAEWLLVDQAGTRLGCLTPAAGSEPPPLYVSRAAACRS